MVNGLRFEKSFQMHASHVNVCTSYNENWSSIFNQMHKYMFCNVSNIWGSHLTILSHLQKKSVQMYTSFCPDICLLLLYVMLCSLYSTLHFPGSQFKLITPDAAGRNPIMHCNISYIFVSPALAGKAHIGITLSPVVCYCCLLYVVKKGLTFGSIFHMRWWISTKVGS